MKLIQTLGSATVTLGLSIALTGVAAAADDVAMTVTGPGSTNSVVTNNNTTISTTNTNVVSVSNENVQVSQSGDAAANENTVVGGAGTGGSGLASGDASNTNAITTTVALSNPSVGGVSTTTPGTGNEVAVGGIQSPGGKGGDVLGAATTGGLGAGVATLPRTGPSSPIDVSAMRAAWQPQTDAPTTAIVKQTQGITSLMLVVATVLSLIGAFGTALYNRRKEGEV